MTLLRMNYELDLYYVYIDMICIVEPILKYLGWSLILFKV